MDLVVNGISVAVYKKKIKNLHLYVKPADGHVEVSAPLSMDDEMITLFVRSKIGWIRKKQEEFAKQPRASKRQYVSGESMYLWGQQYYLQVKYDNRNSLALDGLTAILTVRKASTSKQREVFVNEWYRGILKGRIEKRLPEIEEKTGLHCTSWQIKNMTSRWGTYNIKTGKMWINLQLVKKPLECLDYILIHELVHTKVSNHGDEFIKLMNHYMPNWKSVRSLLNSQILDYYDPSIE